MVEIRVLTFFYPFSKNAHVQQITKDSNDAK